MPTVSSNKNHQLQIKSQERDRDIVKALLLHGDKAKAAKALFISESELNEAMRKPHTRRLIQEEAGFILATEIVPSALKLVKSYIIGTERPDKIRADLCKSVLDRVGFGAVKPLEMKTGEKDFDEMTIDELHAFIKSKEDQSAALATPIAPHAPSTNDQAFDFLE